MTPKEYLQQIQSLETKINTKKEQILIERSKSESCTSQLKERVQTSQSPNNFENAVDKINQFEIDMNRLIDKQIDLKRKIIAKIDKMNNPDHIKILEMKYLKGKNLVEIAAEMDYSYRQIQRKHGWALEEFKKYM